VNRENFLWYLAGLLDGEGHFSVIKVKTPCVGYTASIQCQITDSNVLKFIRKELHTGSVTPPYQASGNRKPTRTWYVCGRAAVELARTLKPMLQIKQKQAALLATFPMGGRGNVSARIVKEHLFNSLRQLNRRGKILAVSGDEEDDSLNLELPFK
jgi:hypothetical protein